LEGLSNLLAALPAFDRVFVVILLTAFINLITTLVRSSRLAGVRTKRLATAISLFGIIFLTASFANTLQAPLLSSTMERQTNAAFSIARELEPELADITESYLYQKTVTEVNRQLRTVLWGATAGTLLGLLLIPSFVATFINIINAFGRTGSVFRLIPLIFCSAGGQPRLRIIWRLPSRQTLREILTRPMTTPKAFLFWSTVSYSVWAVNVLCGLSAAALIPEARGIAISAAAIFGNAAIVINVMMVDPILARVTDRVANEKEQEIELKQIIFYLAIANVVGTLISQIIFSPLAYLMMKMAAGIKGF